MEGHTPWEVKTILHFEQESRNGWEEEMLENILERKESCHTTKYVLKSSQATGLKHTILLEKFLMLSRKINGLGMKMRTVLPLKWITFDKMVMEEE